MQNENAGKIKLNFGKLALLALIGFLVGISLKNIATEKFTMGYNDYKLEKLKSDYILK